MKQMLLKLLGVRGSRPTHKKTLLAYGGNSTSMELKLPSEPFHLFIDGGSGLAPYSHKMQRRSSEFHFLITHTHWDHILGLPFFSPLYDPESQVYFYSSATTKATFQDLFFGMQRADNLPISIAHLKAKIHFKTIEPGKDFMIGDKLQVRTFQINHQGITLAYRLEYGPDSFCIVTDHAPIENGNYLGETMKEKAKLDPENFERLFNEQFTDFLRGCHTVVFDTHFTEETLKPDWGHSTPSYATNICAAAGVSQLILFHHAPEDSDDVVKGKLIKARQFAKQRDSRIKIACAKEGDTWVLRSA